MIKQKQKNLSEFIPYIIALSLYSLPPIVMIPFSSILILTRWRDLLSIVNNKKLLHLLVPIFIYLLSIFLLNSKFFTELYEVKKCILIIYCSLMSIFLTLLQDAPSKKYLIITILIWGACIKYLTMLISEFIYPNCGLTYFLNTTGECKTFVNGSMLFLFSSLILLLFAIKEHGIKFLQYYLLLIINYFFAYFFGSRVGYYALFLSLLLLLILLPKRKIKLILVITPLIIITFLVDNMAHSHITTNHIHMSKNNMDHSIIHKALSLGINTSGRVTLWKEGIVKTFKHPLGNFHVTSLKTKWFHNFWIDSARRGGLLPFVLLVYLTIIFSKNAVFNYITNNNNYDDLILLVMMSALLFNVVVIEGIYEFIGIFFAIGSIIYEKSITKKHNILF